MQFNKIRAIEGATHNLTPCIHEMRKAAGITGDSSEIDHFALSPNEGMDSIIIRCSGGASDVSGDINHTSDAKITTEASPIQRICSIPERSVAGTSPIHGQ